MALLKQAEDGLADVFKGAPKLSDSTRETLVKVWPWLALIGGLLQLLAAWALYSWAKTANDFVDYANSLSRTFGGEEVVSTRWDLWVWIALAMLVLDAVILLIAYPKLKRREKSGWDLLFLASLINVVYGVASLFIDGRGGIGSLFFSLLGSAVGLWLLFETRSKYTGAGEKVAVHTDIDKKTDIEA
ncbi:hypothetical protein H0V99_03960 [Candidatus Saccharibacteria bacterium]|nr:hypothetical protein [Candidatus Saccharibacteria bacterium]